MARTRWKSKGRMESGTFLMIPTVVLDSANFRALSTKAKALLLDMGARFNGFNNGDLAAPWSWMKPRGWKSKDTLHRALMELQQFGIIELTRQGGLLGASLYAFTWLPIAQCKGKLDVAPTVKASHKWKVVAHIEVLENKTPPQSPGQADPSIGRDRPRISSRHPDHLVHQSKDEQVHCPNNRAPIRIYQAVGTANGTLAPSAGDPQCK